MYKKIPQICILLKYAQDAILSNILVIGYYVIQEYIDDKRIDKNKQCLLRTAPWDDLIRI